VLVCGSRSLTQMLHRQAVFAELDLLSITVKPKTLAVLHGGAKGPDRFGQLWAVKNGFREHGERPDWDRGKIAGKVRNLTMLGRWPDLVLAFYDGQSSGTAHTVSVARMTGLEVRVVPLAV
jgi:YspA, cpYpsA-related SLOG family